MDDVLVRDGSPISVTAHIETWGLKEPFRIAGKSYTSLEIAVAEVWQNGLVGRGEAAGVDYMGETPDSVLKQIEAIASEISENPSRRFLQLRLPPGGARNALDCALWDLESATLGQSVWHRLGIVCRPIETYFTLGLAGTPDIYAAKASAANTYRKIKVKLDARDPVACIRAVRQARPDVELIVDVNQSWTFAELEAHAPELAENGVLLIEQPVPRGDDAALENYRSPVPLCADESCLHGEDLARVAERYQAVNIKLDKVGGLTAALELAEKISERGLLLMVGNMMGTSLAMTPAYALAHRCSFVDLDGPLLNRLDRPFGLLYDGATLSIPEFSVWGGPPS